MPTKKQQQLEKQTDEILHGANEPVVTQAPTHGERAGRRRDLTLFELSIDRLRPDPDQVRRANKASDDPDMKELAASIKDKGVLQPLDVRFVAKGDYYEIIAGERRYMAAKMAGLDAVPVKLLDVSEKDAQFIQLIENIHRADLWPTELGAALQRLHAEGHSLSQLAKLLRKSEAYIQKALSIAANLAPGVQAAIKESPRRLQNMENLYELSKLPKDEQVTMWQEIQDKGLSTREVRQRASEVNRKESPTPEARDRGGRPTTSRPYAKSVSTKIGAKVIVRFRKSRATTDEVVTALKQAISLVSS
jgi:ParB family transcriptional regulator, chromosome partitioning protein